LTKENTPLPSSQVTPQIRERFYFHSLQSLFLCELLQNVNMAYSAAGLCCTFRQKTPASFNLAMNLSSPTRQNVSLARMRRSFTSTSLNKVALQKTNVQIQFAHQNGLETVGKEDFASCAACISCTKHDTLIAHIF